MLGEVLDRRPGGKHVLRIDSHVEQALPLKVILGILGAAQQRRDLSNAPTLGETKALQKLVGTEEGWEGGRFGA